MKGDERDGLAGGADDVRVVAVRDVLAPYAWQSLRPEALCRHAVAALDSVEIHRPAFAGAEERQVVLMAFLACHRWRSLTVGALSRQLVSAVETWRQEQAWLDIQLGPLLDDVG